VRGKERESDLETEKEEKGREKKRGRERDAYPKPSAQQVLPNFHVLETIY
jgi:hypothetical protein